MVSGSFDQSAKVWDASSGRELLTLTGHTNWVRASTRSLDGQEIVPGSVRGLAISSDGEWMVTGSDDETAKVWSMATGRELLTLRGHTEDIVAARFSPDGRRILTSSSHEAKLWEANTGREMLTFKEPLGGITFVSFSPDATRIAIGGNRLAIYEAASPAQVSAWFREEQIASHPVKGTQKTLTP